MALLYAKSQIASTIKTFLGKSSSREENQGKFNALDRVYAREGLIVWFLGPRMQAVGFSRSKPFGLALPRKFGQSSWAEIDFRSSTPVVISAVRRGVARSLGWKHRGVCGMTTRCGELVPSTLCAS
jgi:hypothetical protein